MKFIKKFESFGYLQPNSIKELVEKLIEYKIPINEWGKGYAKTIEHLYEELQNDECSIKELDGYLLRTIEYVGVRILYKDSEGSTLLLKEDRQVFKDGRTRRRNMPSSVSEKMKFGEDATISAVRGIEEELGIKISYNQLIKQRPHFYDGGSQSYPGLKSKYKGNHFTCYLTDEQFNPDGYVENQKDKSTFFIWVKRD
jgi:hypothetical protein